MTKRTGGFVGGASAGVTLSGDPVRAASGGPGGWSAISRARLSDRWVRGPAPGVSHRPALPHALSPVGSFG